MRINPMQKDQAIREWRDREQRALSCSVSPGLLANFLLLIPSLLGGWLFMPMASAEPAAESLQIAQQVVDGLPPPPPAELEFSQGVLSPAVVTNAVFPQPGSSATVAVGAAQRYLVYVNGDSDLLLEQVRRVEPEAVLREYEGRTVIQTGLFEHNPDAQEQVRRLGLQGIGAQVEAISIDQPLSETASASPPLADATLPPPESFPAPSNVTPLPTVSVPPPAGFGQQLPGLNSSPTPVAPAAAPTAAPTSIPIAVPPSTSAANLTDSTTANTKPSPYFVIIPAASQDLSTVSSQAVILGAKPTNVQQKESSLGTFVEVGPFVNRSAAERWNKYLRAFGLNARVQFRR
ncbi:MAG: hypothetical protein F6K19_35630 [Cyanothece sp. SIO1E1]|nr:hypothetical protein [Cyanothece sp. SIO1E1]